MQHINGPTINPKNSRKDLKGVLEINFTVLQKYIKIIPIKYAVKYTILQHGNNQDLVNLIEKYLSYQPPLIRALSRKI